MRRVVTRAALICALAALMSAQTFAGDSETITLAGTWQVRLDPEGALDPAAASTADPAADRSVQLPGALRDSGIGDPVGPDTRWIGQVREGLWQQPEYARYRDPANFKVPFWLQPERHYVGPAWYRRSVLIPAAWKDRRVLLHLERPHGGTRVWVDGQEAGSDDSLSIPHEYDLTPWMTPGNHALLVRLDNSLDVIDVGQNAHSVSDHTQTAWHGMVGAIELRSGPLLDIQRVQVYPADDARSARVVVRLVNASTRPHTAQLRLVASQDQQGLGAQSQEVTIPTGTSEVAVAVPFDREARRWDEFDPALCTLAATMEAEGMNASSAHAQRFGVRTIKTRGTQFLLNDRPLFLRGTLECCIFPLTGYPPTDVDSWKRIVRICQAHGLNHIRFHSWCPPEAAFIAADELGFYYQVECSTWPNSETSSLGDGRPIDDWLLREARRILDAHGNHPSFLLLAAGNEPSGPERGGVYLSKWVAAVQRLDDRRLFTGGSGWPAIAENAYHVTPEPRIQQWGEGLKSRINALPPATMADYRDFVNQHDVPVVSHEIGQWCVYPNFDEMASYTGSLKPRNFEIFRDLLGEAGMPDQARAFLMASGKLQVLCYKEEIESALRTPGFGGFQLLDLHDFPGQGTALVGVLDPFWNSKPYVTPAEFREFCGPTVPLARMPQRVWTSDQSFTAEIEVAHYGPRDLKDAALSWRIMRGEEQLASGTLTRGAMPTGALTPVGRIEQTLTSLPAPAQYRLEVDLAAESQRLRNRWDFWVYPAEVAPRPTTAALVIHELDQAALAHLDGGGSALLLLDPSRVQSDVAIGFSSIFWNTAWTEGQAPQTLGVLCDPAHPALAAFPTESHSNWQWWELVSRARPLELDALPTSLRPIVQVVPDWFHPQRLGLVVEARVGQGKLLISSIDLEHDLESRPVARQMRVSLERYLQSPAFDPELELSAEQVRGLYAERLPNQAATP